MTVLEPPEIQLDAPDIGHMSFEEFIRFIASSDEAQVDASGREYRLASGPFGFILLAGLACVDYVR